MTIHKAQGLALDKVVIDIGKKELSAGLTFVTRPSFISCTAKKYWEWPGDDATQTLRYVASNLVTIISIIQLLCLLPASLTHPPACPAPLTHSPACRSLPAPSPTLDKQEVLPKE